jgi:PKD repeat protein
VVDGSSNITFQHDLFSGTATPLPALQVTGASSDVTVEDSFSANGIIVDGGSTGTVLTTNRLVGEAMGSVSVAGATNTAITGNTISDCGPAVSVTGSSSGTSIENNVIISPEAAAAGNFCGPSTQSYGILADASSASSTTADYNDVYVPNSSTSAPYDWSGTAYASASALHTASGQAQHDDNTLLGTERVEGSPLINSANSAAIGEQSTDINGSPRTFDPLVTPTGAGPDNDYDRGAYQFQDPLSLQTRTLTASASPAPVNGTVDLSASATDSWSDAFHYTFSLPSGTLIDAGTTGNASVSFSTPGTYDVAVLAVPANNPAVSIKLGYIPISVVAAAPLVAGLSATANGSYGVNVWDTSTDAWSIKTVSFDFGDGTGRVAATNGYANHTYAKAGTYTITVTVTDAAGATATKSTKFNTAVLVPGTLVNVSSGRALTAPVGTSAFVQSAVTSMPDNSSQLAAVTALGGVEFATATGDGYAWSNWKALSRPAGTTAVWTGIAGMPNGSSQLIQVTSAGKLLHTVRNANGTWQSSGWGSPAGSTGFVRAAITAMPDGSSQLVAVTTAGVLLHNIRFANGSWQGWRPLTQSGVKVVDASIAGLPDGSSQILEVTSAGVVRHNVRYFTGAWQSSGWGTPKGFGTVGQVSISSTAVFGSSYGPGTTVMTAVTRAGAIEYWFRNPDGSWQPWYSGTPAVATWGPAANTAVTTQPDGSYVVLGVTGG